jgi:hypothetical protein
MLLSQILIVKPLPRLADALIDALMNALTDAPSLGGMSVLVKRHAASVILGSLPTVRSWNWLFAEPAQTLRKWPAGNGESFTSRDIYPGTVRA